MLFKVLLISIFLKNILGKNIEDNRKVLGDCCIEGKFTCEDCNDLDNPWILGRTFKVYNYDCKGEKPIYDTALDPTNNEMILNWSGEKWTAYSWYGDMYTRDIFTSPLDTSCPSDIGSGNWFYTNDTSTGEMISSNTLAFTCTSEPCCETIKASCSGNCDQEVINHNSDIFQEFTKVFDINDINGYPIQYHSKDGKYKMRWNRAAMLWNSGPMAAFSIANCPSEENGWFLWEDSQATDYNLSFTCI